MRFFLAFKINFDILHILQILIAPCLFKTDKFSYFIYFKKTIFMKLSQPLFWLLTVLWFAAGTWWYSKSDCSSCNTKVAGDKIIASNATAPSFTVQDGNWLLQDADNLRFGKSTETPVLSTAMNSIMDSLAHYTSGANPSKLITVTGQYASSEKNNTQFENLGLARADAMKKLLMAKGVSGKSILTESKLSEDVFFTPTDTLIGGISFAFKNAEIPVVSAEEKLLFEPRTVYFNTGKNTLNVTADLAAYLEKAEKYLLANADKKLMITGYTDNVGDADKNIQLSAARAAFVKAELVKKGISESQMETTGKGMAEPVADNATADGKAKNRRVTIAIQ